jgi:hypothetical protein
MIDLIDYTEKYAEPKTCRLFVFSSSIELKATSCLPAGKPTETRGWTGGDESSLK